MASKKPAKVNAGTQKEKVKVLPGKALMYFGSKDAKPFVCPTCSRQLIKGIVYEENNSAYCTRNCIPNAQ